MKKLRKSIGVIEEIYEECSITDKRFIDALAMMNPASAVMAGIAFYSFVLFFTESKILSLPVGIIIFFVFFWLGQTLLSTDCMKQIYARISSSLIIILFITIPFKATQMYDVIVHKIQMESIAENSNIAMEMNDKIEEIEKEGERLNQVMVETAERRHIDQQPFLDARRALQSFDKNKQQRIEAIQTAYDGRMGIPEISKFDVIGYYAKNMFSTEKPSELFLNLAFMFFLLFIEASPALIRLAIENGDYINERDHLFALKKVVNGKVRDLERKIMLDDKEIVKDVFKMEILKEKRKQVESKFDDPKKLIQLAELAKMAENDEKGKEDEKPSKNGQKEPDEEFEEIPKEFL